MMTPEDVLIEAISAASRFGDSPALRQLECRKLRDSLKQYGVAYAADNRSINQEVESDGA
jgi:hypothetical protein